LHRTSARQRDDALANPRKNQVPLLIKQLEDKAEKIKRTLEDDRLTLESLRESAKEQNTISHLKDQRASDYAVLKDSIQEHVSTMARFNIPLINNLPSPEVSNGDALVTTIHDVAEVIHDKYYDLDSQLTRATADATKSDRAFSEKNALLTSTQRQLQIEKPKMNRLEDAMKQVRNVVEEIRVYDDALTVDEKHPSELAAYLDRELEEITSAAPMVPETAKKLLRRLLKMVKNGDEFTCPCCKREIETNDVPAFSDNLQALMSDDSPLVQKEMSKSGGDEMKTKIQDWRKIVSTNVGDVRDYWRLIDDIRRLEHDANHLKADVDSARASLDAANGEVRDIQIELTQARELFDASKRWTDDANRIAGKSVLVSAD
jgi:DNA repair exonuclease SbcCD ATPase subunit